MSARILCIDDEPAIRRLLRGALERGGFVAIEAETARAGLDALRRERPDLALLDLGLPDRDGLELVPLLAPHCAVIALTARDASAEKVAALDLGAVDYVVKPFDTEELLARIRVALRSRARASAGHEVVEAGPVRIDLATREVKRDGISLHLPPREFDLLLELARHPGRVLTHRHLLKAVWGPAHAEDIAYLRVAVRALRARLEDDPARPRLIQNDPAIGYRLVVDEQP
jgi:two-component system KDP operon response regulator KdpE